jgi:hypothetical protein
MTEKLEKIPCPHCGKRLLGRSGVYTHIKVKHGGKGKGAFKPVRDDDDESFADRAVQAEIDRACGIPNDDIDWLLP